MMVALCALLRGERNVVCREERLPEGQPSLSRLTETDWSVPL